MAGPARACSCATGNLRDGLQAADGAFVGSLVSVGQPQGEDGMLSTGEPVDWTFEVERSLKGDLGPTVVVRSPWSGVSCGLELKVGQRAGLFLGRGDDGSWTSGLCAQVGPDALLRAAGPLPEPDGSGPARFVVGGNFGEARLLALDALGRTLAYGFGEGYALQVSVCPGPRFVLEVAIGGMPGMKGGVPSLVVRDLPNLEVIREVPLPGEARDARGLVCGDAEARTALIASERGLFSVEDGRVETVYLGDFGDADLSHDVAYGLVGRTLVAVDPATGGITRKGTLPRQVAGIAISPDETRVAGTRGTYPSEDPMLVVVGELATGTRPIELRESPLEGWNEGGDMAWVDERTVAYLPGGGDHDTAHVYDAATMDELGAFDGWSTAESYVQGEVAFGAGWGRLFRALLPDGPAELIREFDSPDVFAIAEVDGSVRIQQAGDARVPDASPPREPLVPQTPSSGPWWLVVVALAVALGAWARRTSGR